QPVVEPDLAVQPERVIDAGHLQPRARERPAMWQQRGAQQAVVTRVGEQLPMDVRALGQGPPRAEPDLADGWEHLRLEGIHQHHRPHLDGLLPDEPLTDRGRNPVRVALPEDLLVGECVRRRDVRHGRLLVTEASLRGLEARHGGEDRLALLHRRDVAGAEAATVPHPIHRVHHRQRGVSRAEEVAVQRMGDALFGDRPGRRGQGLSQHLATEEGFGARVLALSPEQVLFNPLRVPQRRELLQDLAHRSSFFAEGGARRVRILPGRRLSPAGSFHPRKVPRPTRAAEPEDALACPGHGPAPRAVAWMSGPARITMSGVTCLPEGTGPALESHRPPPSPQAIEFAAETLTHPAWLASGTPVAYVG